MASPSPVFEPLSLSLPLRDHNTTNANSIIATGVRSAPTSTFPTPRGQHLIGTETSTSSTTIFQQPPRPVVSYTAARTVRPARGYSSPASLVHSRTSVVAGSSLPRASIPSPSSTVRSRSQGAQPVYPVRSKFQSPDSASPDATAEVIRVLRQDVASLKAEKERLQELLAQAEVDKQLAIAGSTERCFTCSTMKAEKEALAKKLADASEQVTQLQEQITLLKRPPAVRKPQLQVRPRKAAPVEASEEAEAEAADAAWSEEEAEDLEKSMATTHSRASGGLSDQGELRMPLPQKAARSPSHRPFDGMDIFVVETKLPFTTSSSYDSPQQAESPTMAAALSPTSQGFSEPGELTRVRLPQKAARRPSRQPSESSDTLVVETKLPYTSSLTYDGPLNQQQSFLSVDSSPRNEGPRVRMLPQKAARRSNLEPDEPIRDLAIETRLPHTSSSTSCRSDMDKPSPTRQRRSVVRMEDNVDHQDSVFLPDNIIQVPQLPESMEHEVQQQTSSNPSLTWEEAYHSLRAQWEEDQQALQRLQEELQATATRPDTTVADNATLPQPAVVGAPNVPASPLGWDGGKDAVIAQLQRHIGQWRESHGQLARHFEALRAQNKSLTLQLSGSHSTGKEPPGLEWQKGDGSMSMSMRRQYSSGSPRSGGKEVIFGMLGIGVADGMAYGSKLQYRMDYGEARIVDSWAPAKDSGVLAGDVVTAVNGFPVHSLNDLRLCLLFKPVELTLRRQGEKFTVAVTPEAAGPERAPGTRYRRPVVSPDSPGSVKGKPGRLSPSKSQASGNL
eukprot:GGOE01019065.1.p1 GENE.GGOE01019065.1~~GGOE01019065.1.p1  ORF type:complete len:919 (+),score=193.14 GGOE01019065.1:396-2759(+)